MPTRFSLSHRMALGLLLLFTAVMVYRYFGPVISHPNNYLFGAGGDGLKTYYSSQWFVAHNPEGATHTALAYPNGNHLVYADLNPLLSGCIRWVSRNIVDISRYTVGIINLTIILSFFPCVFFVFLILRKNLLSPLYALIFALSISWLSPQIDRFTGHYALSYIFFVPMLWYFLIRMFERKKWGLWLGFYLLALTIFEFAHPYHFLIGAALLYSYLFVHLLQHLKQFRQYRLIYLVAGLTGVLPITILLGWQAATMTTATDFVTRPYGFLYYLAGFETIFLPWQKNHYQPSPLFDFWHYLGVWDRVTVTAEPKDVAEGSAYVGMVGLMMLGLIVVRAVWILWWSVKDGVMRSREVGQSVVDWVKVIGLAVWQKGLKRIVRPVLPAPLRTGIWAAALLLIIASAWPMKQFPALLEHFDFIRQFRSLGRLAWPFYYAFMTLCAYYLFAFYRDLKLRSGKSRLWQAGVLVIALAVIGWGLEARIMTKRKRDYFLNNSINPNFADWRADYTKLLADNGHKPEDFQAILAFPFYHVGSEKLAKEGWNASFYSKAVSLNTGLPIVNNYVARAPLSTSLKTIQLMSDPLIPKPLLQEFPDDRPLLLLYTYTEEQPIGTEKHLIDQSELIYLHNNKMHFAVLPLTAFENQQAAAHEAFWQEKDSLFQPSPGIYCSDTTDAVIVEGFGDVLFANDTLGEMGSVFLEEGRHLIYEGTMTGGTAGLPMEASLWVRLDLNSSYLPHLICQQFEGETAVDWAWKEMKHSTDVWGHWARVTVDFELKKPGNRLKIFADGAPLTFDNLLIRPKGVDVYCGLQADSSFVKNNFWVE